MSLEQHFTEAEASLASKLRATRAGIDDRTGKGSDMEEVVEQDLIRPHLPPGYACFKGSVVASTDPSAQSKAIDRIIYNRRDATPIVFRKSHSVFPIEAVAGLVEITMDLDATKLREDLERMAPVKAMRSRRFLAPLPGSRTKELQLVKDDCLSPRSFVVGLPSDSNWQARTIAEALRRIQIDLGGQTHVHGLYVIGIGFFRTIPIEKDETPYRIRAWLGPDRLFRFTSSFRHAFDRWGWLPPKCIADVAGYIPDDSAVLAE